MILHLVFESLAYALGFALFRHLRRRHGHPTDHPDGGWILVGAVVGGALGAKLLDIAQYGSFIAEHWREPAVVLGGKTIVGGLLGGWAGVELAKARLGITRSTGDLLVVPLIVGLVTGRIGCLLAGPGDHTAGHLTDLPWAIDGRHPTTVYEMVFLLALLPVARVRLPDGGRFNLFFSAYLGFRVVVDFWKAPFGPDPLLPHPDRWLALTPIQWAAAAGSTLAITRLLRATFRPSPDHP